MWVRRCTPDRSQHCQRVSSTQLQWGFGHIEHCRTQLSSRSSVYRMEQWSSLNQTQKREECGTSCQWDNACLHPQNPAMFTYFASWARQPAPAIMVTWDMTAPGGKTVPPPVDNLKLPRTFTEYTECCYHLPDSCFERRTPRSRLTLKYSIFNIYTFFDVIFPHHYTCHSSLYIIDNKESIISCHHMITILIEAFCSTAYSFA